MGFLKSSYPVGKFFFLCPTILRLHFLNFPNINFFPFTTQALWISLLISLSSSYLLSITPSGLESRHCHGLCRYGQGPFVNNLFVLMCMCVHLHEFMCITCVHMHEEAREPQIFCNYTYKQLYVHCLMSALGTKFRSSVRVVSTLNCCTLSKDCHQTWYLTSSVSR